MEEKEEKIIEAEVTPVKLDDAESPKTAKKTLGSHGRLIHTLGNASTILASISSPGFVLSMIFGLMFSIYYSEAPKDPLRFAAMVTCWSLLGVFLLMSLLALGLRLWMRKLKTKDPNFEDAVDHDSVY